MTSVWCLQVITRVGFAIGGDTVSVDQVLEAPRELVGSVECRWAFWGVDYVEE